MSRFDLICTPMSSNSEFMYTLITGIYGLLYSLNDNNVPSCLHVSMPVRHPPSLWSQPNAP